MTPAVGARTSMVTLSVSICAITSSTATVSPGALSTAAMEPSVMESPICGTSTVDDAKGVDVVLNPAADNNPAWRPWNIIPMLGLQARAAAVKSTARLLRGCEGGG
jgi:hypothetical protein